MTRPPLSFSRSAARNLVLAAMGLATRPKRRATKASVLDAIRRMQVLQIDTINVVARSPYLVLFSRLGSYDTRWLDEHLAEGNLFEYWAHEACFIPIEDYSLFRGRMLDLEWRRISGWHEWLKGHRNVVDAVHNHIRSNGAVRSIEFGRKSGSSTGWWDRKLEKHALEMLFDTGELMIARRHHFQRVYDLRTRVHPHWDDSQLPSATDVSRRLAHKAVRAIGFANTKWTADYYRRKRFDIDLILKSLADDGALLTAALDGSADVFYIHPDNLALARRAIRGAIVPDVTTLLSPFDPLVWHRSRAEELFDFEYRIECYTPEAKRLYGYFSLPILQRGALIGRLDAKAHRREGVFEVRSLHFEPGVELNDDILADVRVALHECASWHGVPVVRCVRKAVKQWRALDT